MPLLLVMMWGCAARAAAGVGWNRISLPATGSYALLYVPYSLSTADPVPLIVFLHGAGSSPEAFKLLMMPIAEALEVPVLLPKSGSALGWGPGPDQETIDAALAAAGELLPLDPRRISLAGFSSGGAYAYVLGYSQPNTFNGVFSLSAPYRTVVALGVRGYVPPLYLYYGDQDPNYAVAFPALSEMFDRLGVTRQEDIEPGYGHSVSTSVLTTGFQFLLGQRYSLGGPCLPGEHRLCLGGGRFAVEATWHDFKGNTGSAWAVPTAEASSGLLWFFSADNWEILVKVLDGCAINGHYWVFAAATTDVEYTLQVTDLAAGQQQTYRNDLGQASPAITDTAAFSTCP